MLLLVGLGNPGARYAKNRHNVGFLWAEAIARAHGFSPWRKKFQAEMAEGALGGQKTVLLKPQTFMNHSGQSVGEAVRFFKLTPDRIVVAYDELDLPPGKVRMKTGGGHGGHNGIRDIDAHLKEIGTDYRRIRIGIGHPGDKARVTGHVLGDFAKAEQGWLEPLIDALADNADLLASGNDAEYMNRVHRAAPAPKQTREDGKHGL